MTSDEMPSPASGPADPSRHTSLDAWSDLDDSLWESGDAPAREPGSDRERQWLADQRFVHGLLRHAHSADASGREALVARVMEGLEAADRDHGEGAPIHRPRFAPVWLAAAALLAIGFAFWVGSGGEDLPEVEALAAKVETELTDVRDRRFDVSISIRDEAGRVRRTSGFELTTREGRRYVLEGDGPLGPMRWGSDGETSWCVTHGPDGKPQILTGRRARSPIGGASRLLDLEYLELGPLLARLRGGFDLEGRAAPGDRVLLRFTRRDQEPGEPERLSRWSGRSRQEWRRLEKVRSRALKIVEILADRRTNAVERLALTFQHKAIGRSREVVLTTKESVPVDEGFYQAPQ